MAVGSVTDAERRAFIGLPSGGADAGLDALWAATVALVENHAPDAPEAVAKAAALSCMSYLWSNRGGDTGGEGGDYVRAGNALRKSGAMALLRPYTVHRAGAI